MSLGMALLMMAAPASREDWDLELDKMIAMGAKVENRKTLLDYLSRTYGPKR